MGQFSELLPFFALLNRLTYAIRDRNRSRGDDTIVAVWDAYLREVGVASLVIEVIPTLYS